MKTKSVEIKVSLADDHILLRNALANLIDSFENCVVIHQSGNGNELIEKIKAGAIPDIILLDLNMPILNGLETAKWLQKYCPQAAVLMLTMYDSELTLIQLLQVGVKGFLKKDIHPSELKFALNAVMDSGYYYSNHTTGKLVNLFRNNSNSNFTIYNSMLNDQELQFLKLVCTDLTYKEIARQMALNPRTVDNLRDQLFNKLDVKSRVGLAMVAIKHGVVTH